MKITGFMPQIITKEPEKVIATFEALGFERAHNKTGDTEFEFSSVVMKRQKDGSDDVFRIEIISAPTNDLPRDLTSIRINVDDLDAAYELLKSKGFTEPPGFGKNSTPSSRYIYMASPSGALFDICQHLK